MMQIIREEELFKRSTEMGPYFNEAIQSLKDHPMVKDIRSIGMIAGVEVHPGRGRAWQTRTARSKTEMFWKGLHVKFTGDTGIVAPQFIATREHVDEIVGKFRASLDAHQG